MSRSIRTLVAVAAIALPVALGAQGTTTPAGVALPAPKNQVLSIQPLSAMFTVYSAEYERKIKPTMTLGVGGTYWGEDVDDDAGSSAGIDYTSGDVKLRYYPGANVFQGFSFGGQVGFTRIEGNHTDETTGEVSEGTVSGPTFGIALDYNWLLGASKSFYVGLGVGAKALFLDEDAIDDITARYPTARISIGYAF